MKIGFTGTRKGMTQDQRIRLKLILEELKDHVMFHHGDCEGADMEAHNIALRIDQYSKYLVTIHPPIDKIHRAFCISSDYRKPKTYLERNKDIVNDTDLLIACPNGFKEELRSGTWFTIRYARKMKKKITIIYPDGTIKEEQNEKTKM